MSGVFCTSNAQAPSLFSNVTLTSRRTKMIVCWNIPFDWRRALLPETVSTYDHLRASACWCYVGKEGGSWCIVCTKNSRQAHTRPTNLDDQFLEILTCWTRWQASFFIILKGKTSKPGQMSSSFRKIFEAEKIWQKKHSGSKVTPEEWSCKVWSRFD